MLVHWKYWCWGWNSKPLATSCKELTHWKRLWCWEGLGAEREEDDRGWDGWMASLTQWTWVWENSGSWWWTGRPGVLRFMGSQRFGHKDLDTTERLNWTEIKYVKASSFGCLCLRGWRKNKTFVKTIVEYQVLVLCFRLTQGYGFSSSHVWMWELDYKERWAVVLEKTLESPLDCKEIQLVHPKGDRSWVLIGRTEIEAETPILWPPDAKSWLICKDPDAGKVWGQEEKGPTEDEMVGWHHRLNGHVFC